MRSTLFTHVNGTFEICVGKVSVGEAVSCLEGCQPPWLCPLNPWGLRYNQVRPRAPPSRTVALRGEARVRQASCPESGWLSWRCVTLSGRGQDPGACRSDSTIGGLWPFHEVGRRGRVLGAAGGSAAVLGPRGRSFGASLGVRASAGRLPSFDTMG